MPTDEQKESLANALKEAKTLWLLMGLSTLQPKWHLTFDGHLLDQVTKYGGLADKSYKTNRKRIALEESAHTNDVKLALEGNSAALDHQKFNSISIVLKQ